MARLSAALLLTGLAACAGASPPGGPDSGEDAGGGTPELDGGVDAGAARPCVLDNTAPAVAARDGFLHACADAPTFPRAVCGDGSPYRLAVRPADGGSAGLLLFFRGRGRCDDYVGCWGRDGRGGDGRTVAALENTAPAGPDVSAARGRAPGFFDRGEPLNPFRDFDVVHAPDCTGDLGLGSEVKDLLRTAAADPTGPASVRTHFEGAENVAATVALAKARFPAVPRVVVAGSGEGAWAALQALDLVVQGWPAPAEVVWVADGEAGVGRPDLAQRLEAALDRYDGAAGRRLVRFVQVGFAADPVQLDAAPPAWRTLSAFRPALQALLDARAARAPAHYRSFTPAMACHRVSASPGLFQQYVPWTGGLRPALPATRPNPDLALDGVGLLAWLDALVLAPGPLDGGVASRAADQAAVPGPCLLPSATGF